PKGIRLDSGDLAYLSKEARKMLDKAGFNSAVICASGDLDENSIRSLKSQGAKIDIWGVGTKLITSAEMPALGGVYKLAAIYENGKEIPKIKLSDTEEKITNPCLKEVYRIYDRATDKAIADYIVRAGETVDESKPLELVHPVESRKRMTVQNFRARKLLVPFIKDGKRVSPSPAIADIAAYFKEESNRFWEEYKRQDVPHIYKVDLSAELLSLKREMTLGKGV
ncbi:MAG: nicotinate phosphoribosyltransferase, partial [Clostridia bacterium]|nr:nicotinate phosphoribosyltransferase [Clostridia bacterium]